MSLEDKILDKLEEDGKRYNQGFNAWKAKIIALGVSAGAGITDIAAESNWLPAQDTTIHYSLTDAGSDLSEFIDGEGNQTNPFNQSISWDETPINPFWTSLVNAAGGFITGGLVAYDIIRMWTAETRKKKWFWGLKAVIEGTVYSVFNILSKLWSPRQVFGTIDGDLYQGGAFYDKDGEQFGPDDAGVWTYSYDNNLRLASIGTGTVITSAALTWALSNRKIKKGFRALDEMEKGMERFVYEAGPNYGNDFDTNVEKQERIGRLFLTKYHHALNNAKKEVEEVLSSATTEAEYKKGFIGIFEGKYTLLPETDERFKRAKIKNYFEPKIDGYIQKMGLTYKQVLDGVKKRLESD
jgi:hypothetical protein